MSLTTFAILLSAIGIPMSWRIAIAYLKDPVEGMKSNHHRLECLPYVMTDRYVSFAFMATAATLYRDLVVIAFLAACFAFMALTDTAIYARRGYPYRPHLVSGVLAVIVAAVAIFAKLMNGVAA